MEGARTVSGVPLLPRVSVPLVDTQAVRNLLSTISSGSYNAQLTAAVQLAGLLEAEEGRFRDVVGDPWGGPTGQRAAHSIGRLLACIKERESVYDNLCESWVLSRSVPMEQQVAGLRLVLACLSCWGFQYPLTEDRCMELLLEWAGEAGDETPTPSDPPPADDDALLREARSVYSTGLLAIAMTNEDHAGPASSTPLLPRVAKYMKSALLDKTEAPEVVDPEVAAPASTPALPPPPRHAVAAGDGGGDGGSFPATAASSASPRSLCHPPSVLRRLRLQYCSALLAYVGEYVDALGPVLAERGAEALLELMRRGAAAGDGRLLYDVLAACVALTAHRRFSEQFVEAGGVELALSLPRSPHTYFGLAMLLYSLAAAPLAFERLLTPSPAAAVGGGSGGGSGGGGGGDSSTVSCPAVRAGPGAVVATALSLLSCGQDLARKTAVTFLSSVMHFPATLIEFQAQDGVRRMLNLLRAVLTSQRSDARLDLRMERQVGYYAALTLRQFLATHLVLHVGALRRGLAAAASSGSKSKNGGGGEAAATVTGYGTGGGTGVNAAAAAVAAERPGGADDGASAAIQAHAPVLPYRPVDVSREALDSVTASLASDRRLAEAFVRCRWPALEHLLDAGAPALLLELVSALPPERWFHEAMLEALEAVRLLTLAPLARREVLAAVVPVGGGHHRGGVGVLLTAATLSTSAFFSSDPEMVAEALSTLVNCVTPPPSLAPLLASTAAAARGGGGAAGAGGGGGGTGVLSGATPARRPERASHGNIELLPPPPPTAMLQSEGATRGPAGAGGGGGGEEDGAGSRNGGASASLELIHTGASSVLGQALEAGYVHARQVVRQANGIRSLMQLLQPRHGQGPNAVPPGPLDRIRALACRALIGMAGDPAMRQILTRLQLARLLSDLMREPLAAGVARRPPGAPLEPGVLYQCGPGADWHAAFTGVALELIALTTTGGGSMGPRHGDKFTVAAANDATAPALLKIERAAIAAAAHVSYSPQELLLLVYEHLMASGLHASAANLAAEAQLARASAALHKIMHLNTASGGAPPPPLPAVHGGGTAAGDVGVTLPLEAPVAASGSARQPNATHQLNCSATGLISAACTPYTGGGGGGGTSRKGRAISISAALRDAAAGRCRSDLSHDLARLQLQQQQQQQLQLQSQFESPFPPRTAAAGEAPPATDGVRSGQLKRRASMPLPPVGHPLTRAAAAAAAAAGMSPPPAPSEVTSPPANAVAVVEANGKGVTGVVGGAAAVNQGTRSGGRTSSTHTRGASGAGARKRSSSNVHSSASKAAAAAAVAAADAGSHKAPLRLPGLQAGESREGAAAGATAAAAATNLGTDSDYLTKAFGQQQQQQIGKLQLRMPGLATTPQFLVRAKALSSPFANTNAAGPTADRHAHAGAVTTPFSGGGGGAAAAAAGPANIVGTTFVSGTAGAAGVAPNPLLSDLPSRRPHTHNATTAAALRRHSSNSTATMAAAGVGGASAVAAAAAATLAAVPVMVPELPAHVEAAARDLHLLSRPPAMSKLHHIVMSYLRQQHRQAVMQSAVPTAMLPPISLSRPYVMPQATHALDAPVNVTRRAYRRELQGGHGGRGGARADTQLIYSRFRPLRVFRDEGSLSLCATFVHGWRSLVLGTHGGELKLQDSLEGEILDVVEGHSTAVTHLRSYDNPAAPLLLSSARSDVKLWVARQEVVSEGDVGVLPRAPRTTWDGVTRASFSPDGAQVVAVSCTSARQAMIFDVRTSTRLAVLEPPPLAAGGDGGGPPPVAGGSGSGGRTPRIGVGVGALGLFPGTGGASAAIEGRRSGRVSAATPWACYSPTSEMLLWGNCLYDLRMRTAVHQFDMFTESGSGTFHPAGLEVILNSEIWDLRSFKLLRSVPTLAGAAVAFSGSGDVLYASRRQTEEPLSQLFNPRRSRHPLNTAFRTLDAATYGDIATVAVERVVLDLAVEPSDSLVAIVAVDLTEEEVTASARVYEVGRRRPADDESDAEEEDDEDDDSDGGSEDEDEEIDFDGSDFDTPGPGRRRTNRQDGGGGAAAAALRRLVQGTFRGGGDGEEGSEGDGEGEEGGGGGLGLRAVLGRDGGGGGNGGDEEEDDDGDGDGGMSDDEEVGLAMLEDAYAALEGTYGGDDEDDEYDMDEQDDEDGEYDEEDLERLLEGQDDESDEGSPGGNDDEDNDEDDDEDDNEDDDEDDEGDEDDDSEIAD